MRKLMGKLRLLPLTIFFAAMLLTVKLGDIWDGVDGLLDGLQVAEAEAQQGAGPPTQLPEPGADAAAGAMEQQPPANAAAAPEQAPGEAPAPAARARAMDDPTLFTQSEIDLLQQLAERREVLDQRARELDMREGLLQAAESRIERKVAEMQQLQTTIEGLLQTYDKQQERKLQSLVKIYENMKPKDAARIFEELDMDTLLTVAESMKERKLAPVMANMNPAKAKEMTEELARRRQLPEPGDVAGG